MTQDELISQVKIDSENMIKAITPLIENLELIRLKIQNAYDKGADDEFVEAMSKMEELYKVLIIATLNYEI